MTGRSIQPKYSLKTDLRAFAISKFSRVIAQDSEVRGQRDGKGGYGPIIVSSLEPPNILIWPCRCHM